MPSREEIIEESLKAFSEGDWDRLASFWTDDIVTVGPEEWPEGGVNRGKSAALRQFQRLQESWSSSETEAISHETEGDRTCTHFRWRTRGSASGLETTIEAWMVAEFEGDRYRYAEYFLEESDAREAFRRGAA